MSKLCHVICDYGIGDGAFGEVIQKLHFYEPSWQFLPLSVDAFSTLSTGFWIAQLGLHQANEQTIIFSNTAPRHDDENARDKNEGEPFTFAELKNGVKIGAINAGNTFSFVKDEIVKFHAIETLNKGSQFRSRDFYPEAFVETLNGKRALAKQLDVENIPEIPGNRIAYIDGYGNIKTTIRRSNVNLIAGQNVEIEINGVRNVAIYSDGIFNVTHGQLVFAPGSSGDINDPFMEISYRTGQIGDSSAEKVYGFPEIESKIII